jgi:hypothetical protein
MGLIPIEVTEFLNALNPFSCTISLGSIQPLTEMSKGWPGHKADNLAAICEPILCKIWEP